MIPKKRRIPRKLFPGIILSKNISHSKYFNLRITPYHEARLAVSVSKKVSKKAVLRNRTRRRAYAAIGPSLANLPGALYLLSAQPGAEKLKGKELLEQLAQLFKKS